MGNQINGIDILLDLRKQERSVLALDQEIEINTEKRAEVAVESDMKIENHTNQVVHHIQVTLDLVRDQDLKNIPHHHGQDVHLLPLLVARQMIPLIMNPLMKAILATHTK